MGADKAAHASARLEVTRRTQQTPRLLASANAYTAELATTERYATDYKAIREHCRHARRHTADRDPIILDSVSMPASPSHYRLGNHARRMGEYQRCSSGWLPTVIPSVALCDIRATVVASQSGPLNIVQGAEYCARRRAHMGFAKMPYTHTLASIIPATLQEI
jgi:hypothetical protein